MTLESAIGGILAASMIYAIVLSLLYFGPTITAVLRKNPNLISIFLLNLLLGWTWIGWIIALIWAYKVPTTERIIIEKTDNVERSPLILLQERYAKGEITKEEYEKMKQDLIWHIQL